MVSLNWLGRKVLSLKTVLFMLLLRFQIGAVYAADYDRDFVKALVKNNFSQMEKLLQKRASEIRLVKYCLAPVLYSISGFNKNNTMTVIKLMAQYGADFNQNMIGYQYATSYSSWDYAETPFIYAIWRKQPIEIIQFLLDNGADPNGKAYSYYDTALVYVVNKGENINYVIVLILDNNE